MSRTEILTAFYKNRVLAHRELFRHRHPNETPEFHSRIIRGFHSSDRKRMTVSFRGSAKSTIAEEAILLMIGFREFHTGLILGASFDQAQKRLHAIRREIEKNTKLKALFGDLRGAPWKDEFLEFSNGMTLTAMGKGQALRGTKDEVFRPDFVLFDDIEDKESVRTPEGRDKIQGWLLGEVIPAMDPAGRIRGLANVLDPESLSEKLSVKGSGFECERYPWEYKDLVTGERKATWEQRFPLPWIDTERESMFATGRAKEYMAEYMCISMSDRERPFRQEMRRVEPRVRLWEAVYCMYDPARTVGAQSATTGFAAWSWIGPRLVVWDLWGKKLMPDEIVSDMMRVNETYRPVKLGFEQDGLNEWALQPIRTEQVKRGMVMPLVAVKAPVGKLDFIRGLQIYFNAREVYFTQDFQEAWAQFTGFPTGNIDVPNALAYALHPKMKPGVAVYDDFNVTNVVEDLDLNYSQPAWLALNATGGMVTAVLLQLIDGNLRVYADWVREGDAGAVLAGIMREANAEAGRIVRPVAGPIHFDRYNNVGLVAAGRRIPLDFRRGVAEDTGRSEIRALLRRQARGVPALLVSSQARWTLNSFAGGYCRAVAKGGILADHAEEGTHRVLMEGLEAMAGLMRTSVTEDGDDDRLNATTRGGERYHSARPQR